jgi:hypothetical protein
MNGFTRQETLSLTGITVGMLNYLDETGEIVPKRTGDPKKPLQIAYSAEQVIDLKIVSVLRPGMSLKGAVEVARFVRDNGYCGSVFQSGLATVNGELMRTSCWTETGLHDSFGQKILEVARANKGRVTVHDLGMIGNVLGAIRVSGIDGNVLDFEKRLKGTLLEVS